MLNTKDSVKNFLVLSADAATLLQVRRLAPRSGCAAVQPIALISVTARRAAMAAGPLVPVTTLHLATMMLLIEVEAFATM